MSNHDCTETSVLADLLSGFGELFFQWIQVVSVI